MGHLICLAVTAVAVAGCAASNAFRSEVPILQIDTRGATIPVEPKIEAQMVVHYDPSDSVQSLESRAAYDGTVGIELLGHSSLSFRKKSYALELRSQGRPVAAPLLGLPAGSAWVLHGPYSDKTLMRNYLAYALARRLRIPSPRTRFVELFLREGRWGLAYQGVYLLVEGSERSPAGLGLVALQPGDTAGTVLSGGYILEVDRQVPGQHFITLPGDPMSTHPDTILFVSPARPEPAQKQWLASYLEAMEATLPPADSLADPRGYRQYLDVDAFVDFLLLQEAVKNIDAYRFSSSMYKDRDGKLRMGPIWDFDLSTGNANYDDGCDTDGWMVQYLGSKRSAKAPPLWWRRLLQDRAFVGRLSSRWAELRSGPLATDSVRAVIDAGALTLRNAQKRNFERWPVLGKRLWPNCSVPGHPGSYFASWDDEVVHLRSWMDERLRWIDGHIASIGP
jgi:hypothetical protein